MNQSDNETDLDVTMPPAVWEEATPPPSFLGWIDDYALVRELGGGGFGSVYLVRDRKTKVEYAVKGLPAIVRQNKEELENVLANFRLVQGLEGHHIAQMRFVLYPKKVDYFFEEDREKLRVEAGDPLIVMSYAPGVTLSKWRKMQPGGLVPHEKAVEIVRQIADALDYAHRANPPIIHRDIKPSNVMIQERRDGTLYCRVLDFGLAAELRTTLGRISMEIRDVCGTRPYMATEQWEGERQGAGTDQYALAVLYCELVTGKVPFQSAFDTGDVEIMKSAVLTQRPDLSEIPREARKAVARALAKKLNRRYPTCKDFAEALTRGGSNPWLAAFVGLAALALAAVAFVSGPRWVQSLSRTANLGGSGTFATKEPIAVAAPETNCPPLEVTNAIDSVVEDTAEAVSEPERQLQNHVDAASSPRQKEEASFTTRRGRRVHDYGEVMQQPPERERGVSPRQEEDEISDDRCGETPRPQGSSTNTAEAVSEPERQLQNHVDAASSPRQKEEASFTTRRGRRVHDNGEVMQLPPERERGVSPRREEDEISDDRCGETPRPQGSATNTAEAVSEPQRDRGRAQLLARLSKGSEFSPNPPKRKAGEGMTLTLFGNAKMDFVWCPPGRFLMGSPESELHRDGGEQQHVVTLTKGFWMAKTEVTVDQWRAVMEEKSAAFWGGQKPIDDVTWDQCQKFCSRMSHDTGRAVRLPTEAEWEYACRAGTATVFSFGDKLSGAGSRACCSCNNEPYGTHETGGNSSGTANVGMLESNDWGLCDMHGNVYEWCADWFADYPQEDVTDPRGARQGTSRVIRGGCWNDSPKFCRSAYRKRNQPAAHDSSTGFRVCVEDE